MQRWLIIASALLCTPLWVSCAEDSAGGAAGNNERIGDIEAPSCSLRSPVAGQTVAGSVQVEVEAEDDQGVASVVIAIDGRPTIELAAAPWIWNWDTSGLAPGPYQITATATDAAGNQAQDEVRVNVVAAAGCQGQDCAPLPSFTQPSDGDALRGNVTLRLTTTDDSDVRSMDITVDGDTIATLQQPPWELTWNSDAVTEGAHTLGAAVTDAQGHSNQSSIQVQVDRTPPRVTLATPGAQDVVHSSVTWSATIQEALGLRRVEVFLNEDSLLREVQGPPWEGSLDLAELPSGDYTLSVRALDRADQQGLDSRPFVLDRPPSISFVSPQANAELGGAITIQVNASDDNGVERAFLRIDGQDIGDFDEQGSLRWTPNGLQGPVDLVAVAVDGRGQVTQARRSVVISQAALGVEILRCDPQCQPLQANEVLQDQERLQVRTTPADLSVSQVTWFADGRQLRAFTMAPYELTLDTTGYQDGPLTLRALAQGADANGESILQVRVGNCDRDQDGFNGEACGGLDCDDSTSAVRPGAPDELGDGLDSDCDGADGVDSDGDGFASAQSGGRDCDDDNEEIFPCPGDPAGVCSDRLSDPDNCGACGEVCALGLICEQGQCTCEIPGCQDGAPEDYDFEVPGTWINSLEIVTDGSMGEDLDGDGRPNNTLGPLMEGLADTFGLDINEALAFLIDSGQLSLGATWPNLPAGNLADLSGLQIDFFDLVDADNNPQTTDTWLVDRDSFVPGTGTPRARFIDGRILNNALETSDGGVFLMELPFGFTTLNLQVRRAQLKARATRRDGGVQLDSGQISGVVPVEDVLDGFNAFAASNQCACLDLEEPLIDLRRGNGGRACLQNVNTLDCGGLQNPCTALAQLCGLLVPSITGATDIDADGDGQNDSFGAYFRLTGRGAQIQGLE